MTINWLDAVMEMFMPFQYVTWTQALVFCIVLSSVSAFIGIHVDRACTKRALMSLQTKTFE